MDPACEILDDQTIVLGGTTNSNDIELPDCNPIDFYAKRTRQNQNLNGDIYMMTLNNDGEIIYSSYFGDGSKFDALTSMSYSAINQRLYFGGNSTTLNGPTHQNTSPITQLYMEEFDENSSSDFIKKELGSDVSSQSGTGYVGMLKLEGLYLVEDPCIAGIDDSFSSKALQVVFPNPFNTEFQIRNIEGLSKEDIVLRDLNGKSYSMEVVEESADFWKINSTNLKPGIYILSFDFNTGTVQFKIVKL